ncbi:MAG TPA: DUF488 family protein [Candidatus Dormibacteraeota bacterium]|jgi:uncharacterized protein YeaO (DUF488 family)|nr:DUF488 family protein [Candidatus Dormibacteraeota bacterium]
MAPASAGPPQLTLHRVYAGPPPEGTRVLVDRLWPRGISRERLSPELWLREIAPSDELRRWFGHRPENWAEFRRRYLEELSEPMQSEALDQLVDLARNGPLVLLYSARDEEHNQAVVLRDALAERLPPGA